MKPLLQAEIDWMEQAAVGPFSYMGQDFRLTHTEESTFCATTYKSMLRHGWVSRVI